MESKRAVSLQTLLEQSGGLVDTAGAAICRAWRRVVSPELLYHALPVGLEDGVVTIHTTSSVWTMELRFAQDSLVESLRSEAPQVPIRALRVRVGPLPQVLPSFSTIRSVQSGRNRPAARPDAVCRSAIDAVSPELAQSLASLASDELREEVLGAYCSLEQCPSDRTAQSGSGRAARSNNSDAAISQEKER